MAASKKKRRAGEASPKSIADAYSEAMQAVVRLSLASRGPVDPAHGVDDATSNALMVVNRVLGILARAGGPTDADARYLASLAAHADEPGPNGRRFAIALPIIVDAANHVTRDGVDDVTARAHVLRLAVELATHVDRRFASLPARDVEVVRILRSYVPTRPKKGQRTANAILADLALMVSAFGWSSKMTREEARKTIQVDMARRR